MAADSNYREALIAYVREQARPVDKFSHQPRLYALATQIGKGSAYDDDVVFAAAWIHDLGVFVGHRPEDPEQLARWDNTAYAMGRAPAVLALLGFPKDKIAAVVEAVRTHQASGVPATLEGELLRDADILEQLGAIGILRVVSKVGRDTRYTTFAAAVETLQRTLSELPRQIRLEATRALAERKIRMLQMFLESAKSESQGMLG